MDKEEISILRRGSLTRTRYSGYNFSKEGGESTYADVCDPDVKRYTIKQEDILDLSNTDSKLRKDFDEGIKSLERKTKDDTLLEAINLTKRVIKERDRNKDILSYIDVEENGIDLVVKAIGIKAMTYWENDDITNPSTVLVFDTSIVKKADKPKRCFI